MEIKPTYVTFKQAKWLFEEGFTLFTKETASLVVCNRDGKNEHYSFYKDATKWNLDFSVFSSLKDKCIISFHENVGTNSSEMSTLLVMYNIIKGGDNGGIVSYLAPEQWQVVEWLRVEHGIWVSVDWMSRTSPYSSGYYCHLRGTTKKLNQDNFVVINDTLELGYEVFDSPQEAYSAAFDYIITNNLLH